MCGRYISPSEADMERYWNLAPAAAYRQSFNVAPSEDAWIVRLNPGGKHIPERFHWGFQPRWARRAWINARSETVFSSRAFGAAARRHRCLVPAIGWYEWTGEKPKRQPYVLHFDGFRPFCFAGIWTQRETERGSSCGFAILTRPAPPELVWLHERVPAVLAEERQAMWLAGDASTTGLQALVMEPVTGIKSYAVSSLVNKPANKTAECIRPVREVAGAAPKTDRDG